MININIIISLLITIAIPSLVAFIEHKRKSIKLQGRDSKGRYAKVKKAKTRLKKPVVAKRQIPVYQLGQVVSYITL